MDLTTILIIVLLVMLLAAAGTAVGAGTAGVEALVR
jgi:hypothetical protein